MIRRVLFQVHMWIGLVLGILFVALGLSGSVLVYHDELEAMLSPPPKAAAQGTPASYGDLIKAGRAAAPEAKGNVTLTLPEHAGDAAMVRITPPPRQPGAGREGAGRGQGAGAGGPPRGATVFVDPVSKELLGQRTAAMSPIVQFAHDLHGQLFLGRDGRPYVGWLGVGMTILGLTGLYLWWPKSHLWKYAFIVRRTAKGLRFHRELHAAAGIWGFIVFIIVSVTGVAISFPDTTRASIGAGAPAFNARTGPEIEALVDADRIGADAAVAVAQKAMPGMDVRAVTVPSRPNQAISVTMAPKDADATILSVVYVDPYRSTVAATRDPNTMAGTDTFLAWQRPLHEGGGLGPVWRFLVFLSGFLPLLFVVTGTIMWFKKRRAHVPMNAPLAEGAAS